MKKKKKTKTQSKSFFWKTIVLILVVLVVVVTIFEQTYAQKIYPGVKIGQVDFSGMNAEQTEKTLNNFLNYLNQSGSQFRSNLLDKEKTEIIYPVLVSLNPDLTSEVISFDILQTLENLFQIGRQGNFFQRLSEQIRVLLYGREEILQVGLKKEILKDFLAIRFKDLTQPSQNARLSFTEDGEINILPEQNGMVFDFQKAVDDLENNLEHFNNQTIDLIPLAQKAEITQKQAELLKPQINTFLSFTPFKIYFQDKKWEIKPVLVKQWIEFQKENNEIIVGLDAEKMQDFLQKIYAAINQDPKEAKFETSNDKVVEFQPGENGQEVDKIKLLEGIHKAIFASQSEDFSIPVNIAEPKITLPNINNLGIKELIGRGVSDFSGSPTNRRHNIKVGAETLNGILIKPDEEFSVIKALGKIDAEHNYLPELVIKGDRTLPEFGGGLCQIGTTSFRVALDAGLPILERRPHTYRVVYYEPAGTDATIYDPHPDLVFKNDTGNYILWQTKIEKNKLIFEFWGTSDGRKVEQTKPKIFNITDPGPTRIIETPDLKPDEKKCVEKAHKGADTEFTRTITSAGGTIKEEKWKSHYIPWPEVCLVGKALEVPIENTSTSPLISN